MNGGGGHHDPSDDPDEHHDLVDAIATADLVAMLPRLATYAAKRLARAGWFTSKVNETYKMNPKELVDLAIQRCLEGKRRWAKSSRYPDLESFLQWVIKSLASTAVKADSRKLEDVDDEGDVDSYAAVDGDDLETMQSEIAAAIEQCACDDDELTSFYLTVLDGHTKREDISSALGWDVAKVSRVRIKLQRRLETQRPDLFGTLKKRRAS